MKFQLIRKFACISVVATSEERKEHQIYKQINLPLKQCWNWIIYNSVFRLISTFESQLRTLCIRLRNREEKKRMTKGFLICALSALSLVASVNARCIYPEVADKTISLSGVQLDWPCGNTKNIYTTSGRYIPRNVIATRMQIMGDNAILALPRLRPGVPFTLGFVSLDKKNGNNKVAPFPCWAVQEEGNCNALQNVVDVVYDRVKYLWVLDTGIVNTHTEQSIQRCEPKIIAFDTTGNIIMKINLGHLVEPLSNLQYLEVDYAPNGETFLYITDARHRSIIVYDVLREKGFRVVLPTDVSLSETITDPLYINLAKRKNGLSVLYFTYLHSSRMFSIRADHLRRQIITDAVVDIGPKRDPMVMLGTNGGDVLFFRNKGQSEVYAWDSYRTPFHPDSFKLVQNGNECRLPAQVVPGHPEMWTLENNFQDYIKNKVASSGASVAIHPLKSC